MRLLSDSALRYRRQILHLKQAFSGKNCTVLMLDDAASSDDVDDQVESLAHGVISLVRRSPDYGISHRLIRVEKVRGVHFREGNHDVIMKTGGLVVFPRLVAAEHHAPFDGGSISGGVQGLDAVLGGGVDRGTSTIFMGPAGTGKSTVATCFAKQAADRGEKVLIFIFDETKRTLLHRSRSVGLGIDDHVAADRIVLQQIDPAEISPGELAYRIQRGVTQHNVHMVVIDSLNGLLHSMPEQRHLILQLHELLAFLNQQGVATLMVLTQQGTMGISAPPIDLTYLADTVVQLRFFEARGEVRQAISVTKKRSGIHERTIREFGISSNGLIVGEPLRGFQGVLTGVPTFIGDGTKPAP
jgi:circadian clock protein KaiC